MVKKKSSGQKRSAAKKSATTPASKSSAAKKASGARKHAVTKGGERKIHRSSGVTTYSKGATAKKTGSKGHRKTSATGYHINVDGTSGVQRGHVFVVEDTGVKKRRVHTAKKATAGEIRKSIGISRENVSSARTLLERLEKKGVIPRISGRG